MMSYINEDTLIESLPDDPEEAFTIFESYMRKEYIEQNGSGWREKNKYLSKIIGFISAHEINIGISSDVPYDSDSFDVYFESAERKIDIYVTKSRVARKWKRNLTPSYKLEPAVKQEIHHHINQIRKIFDESDLTPFKKDALFKRLNALSLEVDKDTSRGDTLIGIYTIVKGDLSVGTDKLNQFLSHVSRIMDALAKSTEVSLQITYENKTAIEPPRKQIEKSKQSDEMADDIPF